MIEPRIGSLDELMPTDYSQPPVISWKEFYGFRNEVLRVLRQYGTAGPMGEVDLTIEDEDQAPAFADEVVNEPDFFVVDDMYNEHDKHSLVECDPVHISYGLLRASMVLVLERPGWAVKFTLGDSGIFVASDAILVGGRRFWDIDGAEQIAARCALPVDYGTPTPLLEEQYRFWLAMIWGDFQPPAAQREIEERQWAEAERTLRRSIERRPNRGLSTFDYDEVRYDLHPQTKRQLVSRLLGEVETFSKAVSAGAIRNVERDAADALTNLPAQEQPAFTRQISMAQAAILNVAETEEGLLWWPNIVHRLRGADASLRRTLVQEFFTLADGSGSSVRLSSLFCLAMLRIDGLTSLIDEAVKDHPEWTQNEPLMKWLESLNRGSAVYPDHKVFVKLGLDGFEMRS